MRRALPPARVEVLTTDFKGVLAAVASVLAAEPDVFSHNIERLRPGQVTKSGLMAGLGETDAEFAGVFAACGARAWKA